MVLKVNLSPGTQQLPQNDLIARKKEVAKSVVAKLKKLGFNDISLSTEAVDEGARKTRKEVITVRATGQRMFDLIEQLADANIVPPNSGIVIQGITGQNQQE